MKSEAPPHEPNAQPDLGQTDAAQPDEVRKLLRRGLTEASPERDVLGEVQRKLRERSRGKFYTDGWSVSKHPPISTYLITSLFMLVVIGVLYSVLFSFSGTATPSTTLPEPVQILPR